MSDYLWDKTGEPEEDVERLEELLSELRFQPRTFEVPATLPVRRAPRTFSTLSWSRLAVAASILLTLLAGAWLIATKQRTNETNNAVAHAPSTNAATPQPTQQAAAGTTPTMDHSTPAPQKIVKHESATLTNVKRHLHREELSRDVKRPVVLPRQLNEREVRATQEQSATVTPQEREAMEKFMLAMKVTSEKLNYAERQVADLNAKSPQR
jgi:ABC-type nickel/cobalt efflux system permease component RcnA